MVPPHKRQRTNTNGNSIVPAPPLDDLAQCIDKVHAADDDTYTKQLLLQLATSQPAIAASLRAVEATHYVDEVDSIINEEHMDSSAIKQCDRARLAFQDIVSAIDSIESDVVFVKAHWRTKYSALDALRQIGNLVLNNDGVMGSEIHRNFRRDSTLEDVMGNMLCEMTEDERCKILNEVDEDGDSLMVRIEEVLVEGRHYEIFTSREDLVRSVRRRIGEYESKEEEEDSIGVGERGWILARPEGIHFS